MRINIETTYMSFEISYRLLSGRPRTPTKHWLSTTFTQLEVVLYPRHEYNPPLPSRMTAATTIDI